MEFNTVDGFQGREVDILLLSTVRAAETCTKINSSNIGFVADVRRMNVSLTRARLSLWILGNARTLKMNNNWDALVRDAKERNLVVSLEKPYRSLFKSVSKKPSVVEYSNNCSREIKHDVRKRRHFGSGDRTGDEADVLLSKTKKRSRDERDDPVKKDSPSVAVTSSDGSASKCVKYVIPEKDGTDEQTGGRGKSERQLQTHSSNLGAFENHASNINQSGKERGVGNDVLKATASKGLAKSSKLNRKQMKTGAVIPSSESNVQGRDGNDGTSASDQANIPKDDMTKRKQQRDAVEALLSSALIPSKKAQTSLRSMPVKRPISPKSRASRGI